MKVLVLGSSGMIGRAIFGVLSRKIDWDVYGSSRLSSVDGSQNSKLVCGINAYDIKSVKSCMDSLRPNVVINCIGLTKHVDEGCKPVATITLNALFPHQLAILCNEYGSRMIHISTDCVFMGSKGGYTESDTPDAVDIYGRTKILGEVSYPNVVTLRTSTIGHENNTNYGLLEWFLSQDVKCKGFSKAIFSGLPSIVFANTIRDHVIPRADLTGLYHIGGPPINKFDLLRLIAAEYGKSILIEDSRDFVIDRSFSSARFSKETGFIAPAWRDMISIMKNEKY